MKSLVRIYNLTNYDDVAKIRSLIGNYEGILACEINLKRKEIQVVYDSSTTSIDEILNSIEIAGYMVV